MAQNMKLAALGPCTFVGIHPQKLKLGQLHRAFSLCARAAAAGRSRPSSWGVGLDPPVGKTYSRCCLNLTSYRFVHKVAGANCPTTHRLAEAGPRCRVAAEPEGDVRQTEDGRVASLRVELPRVDVRARQALRSRDLHLCTQAGLAKNVQVFKLAQHVD